MKELYKLQYCEECKIHWREDAEIYNCPTCDNKEEAEIYEIENMELRDKKDSLKEKIKDLKTDKTEIFNNIQKLIDSLDYMNKEKEEINMNEVIEALEIILTEENKFSNYL